MNVKILDCTLRDGGYVNDWNFGKFNISKIISKLSYANVDIIECGFLNNEYKWTDDFTKFNSIKKIEQVIENKKNNSMYVAMINIGEFDINLIDDYEGGVISGLRLAFHKEKKFEAIEYAKELIKKGYKVFIQPMLTNNYSDKELINLINDINSLNPYAFYIVDSFGCIKCSDLKKIVRVVDANLDKNICLGYHAHNNLQLAYSNAQSMVDTELSRDIIIDSSVFGMGRGAGNLNTELFSRYLNEKFNKNYSIHQFLEIIDEVLNSIYIKKYWGYSLSYYLSATFNCHPNYATFLSNKNSLNISEISDVLKMIKDDKKIKFDKNYIEDLYNFYQNNDIDDSRSINILKNNFFNKTILLIGPGNSILYNVDKIKNVICENTEIISVNFNSKIIDSKYIFISNKKRYKNIKLDDIDILSKQLILTSNINNNDTCNNLIVNYNDLLNEFEYVQDNSLLLLINLLIRCKARNILIAGFDGYSYSNENYFDIELDLPINRESIEVLNKNLKAAINYFSKCIDIESITETKYI